MMDDLTRNVLEQRDNIENQRNRELNSNREEYIKQLQQENEQLKKQLEYLRSGEYFNQLKFERNMLENIVQNMKVSKEDKEFIDMTHRNTELLEENEQLKDRNNKVLDEIVKDKMEQFDDYVIFLLEKYENILKENNKEKVDENN